MVIPAVSAAVIPAVIPAVITAAVRTAIPTVGPSMRAALDVVRSVEVAGFAGVVLVVLRRRRIRVEADRWVVATFALLAAVSALGYADVTYSPSIGYQLYARFALSALVCIPWLLVRLSRALQTTSRRLVRAANAVTVASIVATFALPALPNPLAPRPLWVWLYVLAILTSWVAQSVPAGYGLWRAGRGQSTLVRRRMRLLGAGVWLLAIALLVAGFVPSAAHRPGFAFLTTGLDLVASGLFVGSFLLPRSVRVLWRQPEREELTRAEAALISATTPEAVAQILLPHVAHLLGARGAALLDGSRRPVGQYGLDEEDLAGLRLEPAAVAGAPDTPAGLGDRLVSRLASGWLVVRPGPFSPVSGSDELDVLRQVGHSLDLALARAALHERERASRVALQTANEELEGLVYSVSHDLRSPLISLLGYLECLREDFGQTLPPGATHYLERMTVNAAYMRELIGSLLDLARLGRAPEPTAPVELSRVVAELANEFELEHPGCRVEVAGTLPVVLASDLRIRQLFTNLFGNAAQHVGRAQVAVRVRSTRLAGGGAEVVVSDDGPGVPREHWERIFSVFERLTGAGGGGTGVGLAICRRIMNGLGGEIRVGEPTSADLGGAAFLLNLPAGVLLDPADRARAEGDPQGPSAAGTPAGPAGGDGSPTAAGPLPGQRASATANTVAALGSGAPQGTRRR